MRLQSISKAWEMRARERRRGGTLREGGEGGYFLIPHKEKEKEGKNEGGGKGRGVVLVEDEPDFNMIPKTDAFYN